MKNFEKLNKYLKEISNSRYLGAILNWEMDIVAPQKSLDYLIDIKTKCETKTFALSTSDEYITLLNKVINSDEFPSLSPEVQRTLKQMIRDYEASKRVPQKFYEEYCSLVSKSQNAWVEAKKQNDYQIFKPYLQEIITKTKQYYTYMYPNTDLYNSMLDTYEYGIHKEKIDALFSALKEAIIPLVKNLHPAQKIPQTREFTAEELLTIAKYLLEYIGFDNSRGTLGIYPHGYTCKMNNNDIRIAFSQNASIFNHVCTIIHEGGHGIFEQNINANLKKLAICEINKYALHESQSRFYENILGRNYHFWTPIYKDLKDILQLDMSQEEFISSLNNAHPSLIRTEADELTYCLHIILRYEIERDLFSNKITVDELPTIWQAKTKEYLGLDVPNDASGILQDVHWSQGSFGYFPSYLIGSIFDGMLIEIIEKELGDINTILKNGDIKKITKFLNDKIHAFGGAYSIEEVAKNICGQELTITPLVQYFKDKYEK